MNNLEGGYEERLRKRRQVVLLGWCTPCGSKDNWGWLKFSIVPTQNFTLEYIIASGYFADFLSSCCLLSRVRPGHGTSCDHWNIWRLENGGKWSIIDGLVPTMCVSAQKIEASKSFPEYFVWTFLLHKLYQFVQLFLPWLYLLGNIVHNLLPIKSWHMQTSNFGMCRPRLEIFVGFAYQGKDIVFRFIIEYSSLRDFGPYLIGLFFYEDFWKMIFWLVFKLEISYRVIISWRILISFREFFEDYIFCTVRYLSFHNSSFALRYF
jgi:hypothetical protein